MNKARIFNIERFATEDGPGIRTAIFFKGCSLRCLWCANPESQLFHKEVIYNRNLCTSCVKCIPICEGKAITYSEAFGYITDSDRCSGCGKCVDTCLSNARTLAGEDVTVDEVVTRILKDKKYYDMSGGGVTFTGGEPLLYDEFIKECILRLKEHNITSLVETCGQAALENFKKVVPLLDYIYYDIKHMDPKKHKEYTGTDNSLILSNLNWIADHFKGNLSVRYPYIPGYNADEVSIKQFMDYIVTLKNISDVVFLPYHRLGLPKYLGLGRRYGMGELKSLKKMELSYLLEKYKDYKISIKIQ